MNLRVHLGVDRCDSAKQVRSKRRARAAGASHRHPQGGFARRSGARAHPSDLPPPECCRLHCSGPSASVGDVRTFDEARVAYLRHHEVYSKDTRTAESQARILAQHFKGTSLSEMTPHRIADFVAARRAKGASEATVNRNLAALSKMFSLAIDDGLFAGPNPLRRVRRFKESPGRVRFLNHEEVERLVAAAKPHLRPVIQTALLTGGRLSEVLGLRWADVDLQAGVVYYRRETAKSRRERMVPLVSGLRSMLASLGPRAPLDPVFTYRGRRFRSVRTSFARACIKASVPDARFHDTRRTFATGFIMRGGDPYRLQRLLGHSTIELTQRYARLSPEYLKAGADFIGLPTHDKKGH